MDVIDTPLGSFQLAEKIGFGRLADVYRVICQRSGHSFALKVFTHYDRNPALIAAAIRRESNACRQLAGCNADTHIQLCLPLAAVTFSTAQQLSPALLLPYVTGTTLADWLGQQPPISHRLSVLNHILSALSTIHEAGIAHNDLSFGNIMITPPGIAILDYDRAESLDITQADHPAQHIGAFYDSSTLGRAADLRAFAILVYLILCGQHPFVSDLMPLLQGQWHKPNPFLTEPARLTNTCEIHPLSPHTLDSWLRPLLNMEATAATPALLHAWITMTASATSPIPSTE